MRVAPSSREGYGIRRGRGIASRALGSDDARDVRLGLDLLAGVSRRQAAVELQQAADHADPEVRVRALVELAAAESSGSLGGAAARGRLAASAEPADRRAAAAAMGARAVVADDRPYSSAPGDPDPTVRAAALDAVRRTRRRRAGVIRHVVAAMGEPALREPRPTRCGGSASPPSRSSSAALARDADRGGAFLVRAAAELRPRMA